MICLAIAVMAGRAGHARLFNASVDEIEHEAFCLVKGFDDARAHLRVSAVHVMIVEEKNSFVHETILRKTAPSSYDIACPGHK